MHLVRTTLHFFCLVTLATYAQSQPNILLIVADDLGNDAIEGFGIDSPTFPTTPTLDELRANGVSYMNTWASPQCTPTRASIMSGKYGIKTGVMRPPGNLDLEHESIFSYLDNNTNDAYSTAVIGKWHVSSPTNLTHPIEHGADHYEGMIGSGVDDYYNWQKVENGQYIQVEEYATTHITNAAIEWISEQDSPWLMWLAHVAPHAPFQVPPDGLYSIENPTTDLEIYQSSIEAMDYEIGRLLESMTEETRANTLIIFIGDNGTPNRVLQGYPELHGKTTMYEGGIRVPMIISGSGVSRAGQQDYGLTQANDLYATIIEACSNSLPGGIYNSYSILPSFSEDNTIARDYVYADYLDGDTQYWAIRNQEYKLIQDEAGNQEFYRIDINLNEDENLTGNLTPTETEVLADLQLEAQAIRTGWSCQDLILNGAEETIDDCNTSGSDCPEMDVLSDENIGCCATPDQPSVYHEYLENGQRNIYSNGFPNHNYCFNTNILPEQAYNLFRVTLDPQVASESTPIIRENGRPARHLGVVLNGVMLSPAPGTPFIYVNKTTGEFNWDWVFEPTTNQGDEMGQVQLDCATAHTSPAGYHYHGEMFEYLETEVPGITTATSISKAYQIGWASDGFPIIYKFGPDSNGQVRELNPSYRLKLGERPGDGITAPCGPYTGKYTNDYEYVLGAGDLDECNGIAAAITLETALGVETFDYYYVVTSSFPQIGRCLKGTVSADFENSADPLTGVDMDGDGYLSQFECDDTNPGINPSAEEIPDNGIDEDCDGSDLISSVYILDNTSINIYPNPTYDAINIEVSGPLDFDVSLYSTDGQLIAAYSTTTQIFVNTLPSGTYLLEIKDRKTRKTIVERITVGH